MKAARFFLTSLLLIVCSITTSAAEYDGNTFQATTSGVTMKFQIISVSNKTCRVYGSWNTPSISNTTSGSISIPSSIYSGQATYTVIEVGYCAFYGCSNLTSVSLPYTVKTIGNYAFYNCESLSTMNLYNTETIGYQAFYGCKALKVFPTGGSNLKEIGDYAFQNCENMETVTLPDKVTKIGSEVFWNCKALTTFSGGKSLKEVGTWCFENCENLTTVTFPTTLTRLENSTFYGCKKLTTVNGLTNVEYIGSSVFPTGCPWYTSLPDGQIYIGKIFYKYKGTIPEGTTINIKEGTKGVSQYAINGSGLVALTIPQSVTEIGSPIAYDCINLNSITVASGNSRYDSRNNCNAIIETATNLLINGCTKTVIPNTVTAIGYDALRGCGFTSVTIPDKVDSIASDAFYGCKNLKQVTVGKGVRKIMSNPFAYCYNIEDIIVSSSNPYFDSRNNCKGIIEKSTNTLRLGCSNTVIPSSVKAIGNSAFRTCGNGNMLSYTIPNQIEKIENYAFEYLSSLRSITIGSGVKEMGNSVFYGCNNLTSIHSLIDFPFEINENVFANNVYETATLYVPIGSKASYQMTPGWNKFKNIVETDGNTPMPGDVLTAQTTEGNQLYFQVTSVASKTCELIGAAANVAGKITIPATANGYSVTAIGNRAFYNYSLNRTITEVVIPEKVTAIGEYAFYYCKDLAKVNIPSGVTSIGAYAFYNCNALSTLVLPASLKSIGGRAFGYTDVKSIAIPQHVEAIGKGVFIGCANLEIITVDKGNSYYEAPNNCNAIIEKKSRTLIAGCKTTVIPNTVEGIGYQALGGNKSSTKVTIPNSVAVIDTLAFVNLGIKEIVIPASVRSIARRAFGNCDSLVSVTSLSEIPIGIDESAFEIWSYDTNIYEQATLYVPYGSKRLYAEADGWKLFKNIVEREGGVIKGDVNGDGQVNGTDLVALSKVILEQSPMTAAADVNNDEKVNGADFVALVNIVLGKNLSRSMARANDAALTADIYIEPFAVTSGESCEMLIGLNNPDADVTLMQFDLTLPKGLTLKTSGNDYDIDMTGRTTWRSHLLNANSIDNGIRFLLCSMSNTTIDGNQGAVIRLMLQADSEFKGGSVTLNDILCVTPDMQEIRLERYSYQLGSNGTTGINTVTGTETEKKTYSLSGQRLSAPGKGINIKGGKKLIVK